MENLKTSEIRHAEKQVAHFLEKYGMHYAGIDLLGQLKLFTAEMVNGLEGRQSSLKMYPTFIEFNNKIPKKRQAFLFAIFNNHSSNSPIIIPPHKHEPAKA